MTQKSEKATPNTAAQWERKLKWQCGSTVNVVETETNNTLGWIQDMTIISYENSEVFWYDLTRIQWQKTDF